MMPELPEVETVKRILEPQLTGRRIRSVTLHRPEVVAHPGTEAFQKVTAGRMIAGMGRRGKFIQIFLDNGDTVILHLRMTGCLLAVPDDYPEAKHTHVRFLLEGGGELRFIDPRRFGRLWLKGKDEEDTFSGIGALGPEPFDPTFNAAYLQAVLGDRQRKIKECLLDQRIVAGIGNIYADEILFASGIRPDRPAAAMTQEEWGRLAAAVPALLLQGIEADAMTPEEYLARKGEKYRSVPFFQVYGREGESCPRCGCLIRRVMLAGRSSCYCPCCQASPSSNA